MTTTTTKAEQLFQLNAVDVAALHIQPESQIGKPDSIQTIQTSHRLDLLYTWLTGNDPLSSNSATQDAKPEWDLLRGNVIDLGCGQGDQTGALTALMAKQGLGNVVGVDPALESYGAPYTLKQTQDHMKAQKEFDGVLQFKLGDTAPEIFKQAKFDTVIMSHCLWYFPSARVLKETLQAIRNAGVKHLLLAEWGMTASHPHSLPHLLAVLIQGQSPLESGNVQTPISPAQIKELARQAGWRVDRELTFAPAEKMHDGGWEVYMAKDAIKDVEKLVESGSLKEGSIQEKQAQIVLSTKYALEEATQRLGKKTRCMDVWTAVLTPA